MKNKLITKLFLILILCFYIFTPIYADDEEIKTTEDTTNEEIKDKVETLENKLDNQKEDINELKDDLITIKNVIVNDSDLDNPTNNIHYSYPMNSGHYIGINWNIPVYIYETYNNENTTQKFYFLSNSPSVIETRLNSSGSLVICGIYNIDNYIQTIYMYESIQDAIDNTPETSELTYTGTNTQSALKRMINLYPLNKDISVVTFELGNSISETDVKLDGYSGYLYKHTISNGSIIKDNQNIRISTIRIVQIIQPDIPGGGNNIDMTPLIITSTLILLILTWQFLDKRSK